jgi:hypothetical protein
MRSTCSEAGRRLSATVTMSANPHQIAWNEARALLTNAERALVNHDPAQLGGATAETDSAITLLQRLVSTSNHPAPRRLLAAAWSIRARLHAQADTSQSPAEILRAYGEAVACLRTTPEDADLQVRTDLAVALHQLGNARQERDTDADRQEAIANYDEALNVLRTLPVDSAPGLRRIFGAVWLNRGAVCVRCDDAASAAQALHSFDEAIKALQPVADEASLPQRINLAAAWMNRAHAGLRVHEDVGGAIEARAAAREALALVHDEERDDVAAADVALKARHIGCRALALMLTAQDAPALPPPADVAAEAADLAEEGLALARHWLHRKAPVPSGFVHDLFRFGAQAYLNQQPHFLAEFVLENLDPETSADALPWHPALHAVAVEAVARALRTLERPQFLSVDAPGTDRRIQSLHELRHAAARLEELHLRAPADS